MNNKLYLFFNILLCLFILNACKNNRDKTTLHKSGLILTHEKWKDIDCRVHYMDEEDIYIKTSNVITNEEELMEIVRLYAAPNSKCIIFCLSELTYRLTYAYVNKIDNYYFLSDTNITGKKIDGYIVDYEHEFILSNKNAKEFIDNLLKESIKSLLRYNNKPPNNYLNNNKPKDYFDLNIIFPTIINCSNVYLAVSDIDSEIYTFRLLQKLKDELEDVQIFQFPLMRKLYIDFLAPTLLMEDYIQITSYEPDYSTLRFDNLGNESKSITYHMNKNLNYFSSLRFKHFIFGKEEDDESNRMISFDNSDTLIIDLRFQYLPRKLRIDRIIDEKLYK